MLIQCIKCDRFFRSFSRIKIHKAQHCPAEVYEDTKEEDNEVLEDSIPKEDFKKEGEATVKREPQDSCESGTGRRDPYAGGHYRPAAVVTDTDSEYEVESDDSAPEDGDIEAQLGMLTKWNPHKKNRANRRKRKREFPSEARVVYMVSATGQNVKRYKVGGNQSQRWTPPHPWIPYPTQVTVQQCCLHLQLRDYPILVNERLKERFKDKTEFDKFATPRLRIANPGTNPLVLKTLVRAKWFEVMNTETAEERRRKVSLEDIKLGYT